jgi:hypothetical protein
MERQTIGYIKEKVKVIIAIYKYEAILVRSLNKRFEVAFNI